MSILDLRAVALENTLYRVPLYVKDVEVTIYALRQREIIANEIHKDVTQLIYVVEGTIAAMINGQTKKVESGSMLIIPANTYHEIAPTYDQFSFSGYTRFFSIYSRPQHAIGDIEIRAGL